MFGSPILDVAIGLVFIFLLLSIIASAMREALEGILHSRASQLERGMRELLHDPKGTGLTKDVYSHPLICSLFRGHYDPELLRGVAGWWRRRQLPSYIPKEHFALALTDMVVHGRDASRAIVGPALSTGVDIGTVRAALGSLGNPRVERAILTALDTANGDAAQVRRNLEDWFDGSMDRVSGWYKRHTQFILLGIGLVLAVGGNVDTLGIAQYLNDNKGARDALVAQATIAAKDSAILKAQASDAAAKLDALKLPIGWSHIPAAGCDSHKVKLADTLALRLTTGHVIVTIATKAGNVSDTIPFGKAVVAGTDSAAPVDTTSKRIVVRDSVVCIARAGVQPMSWDVFTKRASQNWIGWLMTAFAISFGAPFWFDVLNKIIVVRSTVKPKEKSADEGSKDKAGSKTKPAATTPAPTGGGAAAAPVHVAPATVERTWAEGDPQEGLP